MTYEYHNYVKAKTTDLYVCMNLAIIYLILLLSFHISTLVWSVKAYRESSRIIWGMLHISEIQYALIFFSKFYII